MQKPDFKAGEVFLLDKPLEWTSFNVVSSIRYQMSRVTGLKRNKVGHAGTLDPLATGLLIICTGKATKQIDTYQAQEKEYTGTFLLGATTPCFDKEQEVDKTYATEHITKEMIEKTAQTFLGQQEQIPPIFSAIKIKGKRAYKYAREEEEVVIKPKQIEIKSFEITAIRFPEVDFRITCSKGTYIRSLARDFGQKLDSGAYLIALRRTKIGNYDVKDALTPKAFKEKMHSFWPDLIKDI
ncbi:MAG: tRNA pseudouridine(55) synthase TruB [Bacteroidetes bacterium 4572_77]|nr:MAG: tRNA pseudouridine(55) synthase TruB [Bacteroidetes bacterium 4572_77]